MICKNITNFLLLLEINHGGGYSSRRKCEYLVTVQQGLVQSVKVALDFEYSRKAFIAHKESSYDCSEVWFLKVCDSRFCRSLL